MNKHNMVTAMVALSFVGLQSQANAQFLGSANSFAILGGSTVTNTGNTVVNGNLGVSPGTAITGFPPGIVNGNKYDGDSVAAQAEAGAHTAYNELAGETPTEILTGQDLGGLTLAPGTYFFESSANLTGILTLDSQGNPNARFDFLMGSTLTTASNAAVDVLGGDGSNVYWQVGSSATLGTGTNFAGHIIADQSVTLTTGAKILNGSAIALNGAVTMDGNTVTEVQAVPEPTPIIALGLGILGLIAVKRRAA